MNVKSFKECSIWFELGGELSKEMKSVIKQKVKGIVQGNETCFQ